MDVSTHFSFVLSQESRAKLNEIKVTVSRFSRTKDLFNFLQDNNLQYNRKINIMAVSTIYLTYFPPTTAQSHDIFAL